MNNQTETKSKEKKQYKNLVKGLGINLLPPKTETEVKVEATKSKLNINAAVSILVLVVFTILIFGYNTLSKVNLNVKKAKLNTLEESLNQRSDMISSNDEILKRVKLYQDIEKTTVSSKSIVNYWNSIASSYATIGSIEIASGLVFTVTGTSSTLNDASKLWYILANDKRINSVNLESITKDKNVVRFTFKGELNFDEFSRIE